MKRNEAPKHSSRKKANLARRDLTVHYYEKYFSLWMNKYPWEGITDEQKRFLMKEWWNNGQIAVFKLEGSSGSTLYPEGAPVFTPFSVCQWDYYRSPLTVTLTRLNGVTFIPTAPQEVNKDVVLGWAHRSHKAVRELVRPLIERLVDVEMVIRMNLKVHKMPWLIGVTPETKDKLRELANALEDDDPALFVDIEDVDKAKALISGAPYILDKLHNYKQALENELRELLGLDNLGVGEKKEHLVTAEIQSNDEVTSSSTDCFADEMIEFTERIHDYLGMSSINVFPKIPMMLKETENEEENEDESNLPTEQ